MKVLVIIILILVIALLFSIWIIKRMSKEDKAERMEKERLQKNLDYVLKHSQDVADLQRHNATVQKAIANAETEEDYNNIIASIIECNNTRL